MADASARLSRIAEAHTVVTGPAGLTSGLCSECNWTWPCPTYRWATEPDLDPIFNTWDPNDAKDYCP